MYNTGRFTSISNYDFKLTSPKHSPKKSQPDSPSEAKFKLAETLYIPKLDKTNNWYSREYVDELQKFYQKERESLKSRLECLTLSSNTSHEALLSQVESLRTQLRTSLDQHKQEILSMRSSHASAVAEVTKEKDKVICELKGQVYEIKNELSRERLRVGELEDELNRIGIKYR